MTGAAPVRFEEVGYNYGFVPVNPSTNRGYCMVYRILKDRLSMPYNLTLVRGNEHVIQLKDIGGPVEDREKVTIFCEDIVDFYPFDFQNKSVGFLIQAVRRSKTGYWFVSFQREGILLAFCEFLHWVMHGQIPRRRSQSARLQAPRQLLERPCNAWQECDHECHHDDGDLHQVVATRQRRSRLQSLRAPPNNRKPRARSSTHIRDYNPQTATRLYPSRRLSVSPSTTAYYYPIKRASPGIAKRIRY